MTILDGLRGMAAVSVATLHFTLGMPHSWFTGLAHWGWLGVDVFFVISGFIIPYSLMRSGYSFPNDYLRFLTKRIVRLHPPYLFVVIVMLCLSVRTTHPPFENILKSFGTHLFLANGILGIPWLNNVFWSLAIELQYYILIGIVCPVLMGSRRMAYLGVAGILAVSLLPISQALVFPHLPLFACGILALLRITDRIQGRLYLFGLLLAGAACCMSLGKPQALAGVMTALIISELKISVPQWLSLLGAISYSLYLLHPILIGILGTWPSSLLGDSSFAQLLVVAILMAIAIAAAWICHRYIEAPSHALASRIHYRRKDAISR